MNIDLLIKAGLAATSVISLGLGMVQNDRAEKRNDQLIKDSVKEELQKKERWRKKPNN